MIVVDVESFGRVVREILSTELAMFVRRVDLVSEARMFIEGNVKCAFWMSAFVNFDRVSSKRFSALVAEEHSHFVNILHMTSLILVLSKLPVTMVAFEELRNLPNLLFLTPTEKVSCFDRGKV